MKALRFNRFGDLSVLRIQELPTPQIGNDEVLVRIHAASINPSDVKNVQGHMEGTTLPRTPGRDFAGVVVNGPPELTGKEVFGTGGDIGFTRDGSHAEFIVVSAQGVALKPKQLSMEEAASVGVNYLAAYIGLVQRAGVRNGEVVLVTGASGGVGTAVIQLARWKGARVIAVDRRILPPDKLREQGIDLQIDVSSQDYEAMIRQVREFTSGNGANIAFDCVGGPLFEPCLRSLGQSGRQVNIVSVGTRGVSFDLTDFYHRQLTLYGVDTRAYDTVASAEILKQLTSGFESGTLRPAQVVSRYSLDQAVEAYREVNSGAKGKVVLT
ncbi:MAG TPA: zinc-binding alcohol dehydrogenase family protein [Candidatus Angelobacter sp.]|nr:zinc-binding alcohol dehydrogenase family protein [Candidatus Angelobacter sp.]